MMKTTYRSLRPYRMEVFKTEGIVITYLKGCDIVRLEVHKGTPKYEFSFMDRKQVTRMKDFLQEVLDKMPGPDTIDT
jgi:hypothetical protein